MAIALLSLPACQRNTIELETGDEGADGSATTRGSASAEGPSPADPVPTPADADTGPGTGPGPADTGVLDTGEGSVDSGTLPPPDPAPHLLAISAIIDPQHPFQGLVWINETGDAVDLTLQWLSLDPGSTTEPREPVGDPLAYSQIPLNPDGSFTWELGQLELPGEANPITGSPITVSPILEVRPDGDPYCGPAGGEVLSPIMVSLDGSTHAITGPVQIDALPLDFPVRCP